MTPILITGAAGFIGFHVAKHCLERGERVVGFDNLNSYYSPSLKRDRLAVLSRFPGWEFVQGDLCDGPLLREATRKTNGGPVVHLAAQAGVRWSSENPAAYLQSNVVGFGELLEACRAEHVPHLIYASSSSVYGANTKIPFSTSEPTNHPVSLYGATKKANELMAHSYSHLFGLPTTGLRFFTVYGPWGRPDMAYWKFTEAILAGTPIDVHGGGVLRRDFTYIADVVEAIVRIINAPPQGNPEWSGENPDPATSRSRWRIYNIGNHTPVTIDEMISHLEDLCERKAVRAEKPTPPGDLEATCADVDDLVQDFEFRPSTRLRTGLERFVSWYREWFANSTSSAVSSSIAGRSR
jgi:UDP-glucuronate 4-epimerase